MIPVPDLSLGDRCRSSRVCRSTGSASRRRALRESRKPGNKLFKEKMCSNYIA